MRCLLIKVLVCSGYRVNVLLYIRLVFSISFLYFLRYSLNVVNIFI